MEKELLTAKRGSVTLNVTGNRIDSYRKKDETQNTVRVYKDGKIGIAGSLGEADWEKLTAEAEEALSNNIPYPCRLDENKGEERSTPEILPLTEFLPKMQKLLDRLAEECPNFAVSNKIELCNAEYTYQNSKGSAMLSASNWLTLSLIFQNKGAGNLFDCFYGVQTQNYNEDAVAADCKKLHDAFYQSSDIEAGEYPVLFMPNDILGSMINHFVAELYASGASLLSGKLGEKVANSSLTLCDDRNAATNYGVSFFDDEGQTAPGNRQPLIENGILTNLLVSKNSAAMFGLPAAATSSAAYDGVPSIGFNGAYAKPTADKIADIAPGKAVLVWLASGGDMTPEGGYATPVQLAYLVENGEIKGRLPDISVSGNFFELLGDGYLGAAGNTLLPSTESTHMAFRMKVSK